MNEEAKIHGRDLKSLYIYSRKRGEVVVLGSEPDELGEERERLVHGAHDDGAPEGADKCGDPQDEVEDRDPTVDPTRCLGGI